MRRAAQFLSLLLLPLSVFVSLGEPGRSDAAELAASSWTGPMLSTLRTARPAGMAAPDAAITVCAEGCDHQAIQPAIDAAQTGDAIFVGNGVYTGTLEIATSVDLQGVDPSATVLDGRGTGPVVHIRRGVGVTITGFTITGGRAASGAGIYNEGSVFVNDCVIEDNRTTDENTGYGGGVFNYGGTMTLTDVIVQDNHAELGAGLLNSYGGMNIARGAIRNNVARQFGGGIFNGLTARLGVDTVDLADNRVEGGPTPRGGAIFNTGFANIGRSALSGNESRESGGAIYQYADTTILSNSTMSANVADFGGSGMYIAAGSGLMTNVTVADNSGGFGAVFSNDVIEIRNSLIGNNSPSSCFGSVTSAGHNLDSGNTCSFDQEGDLINTNPRTLPVGDHGGPTHTIALTSDSPAIDAGDPQGCTAPDDTLLTTDQRGSGRPLDGDGDGIPICDMGAYEFFDEEISPTPTPQSPEPVPGQITVCPSGCDHASIQAAVDAAPSGATVAIQAGTYVENVVIDNKPLTLLGAGAPFSIIDGGRAGPVLDIRGAVAVSVRGLALTKGGGIIAPQADLELMSCAVTFNSSPRAGGIYSAASLSVEDCDIASNVSLTRGGGIHVDGGSATVRRSRIRSNTSAVDGGGIFVAGNLTVEDSDLSGNGGRYGGGISARGAEVELANSDLIGNRAEYGAGLFLLGGSLDMQDGLAQGNRGDVGGGFYIGDSEDNRSTAELRDVEVVGNVATGDFGTGGGLTSFGSSVEIVGGLFRENTANFGGALYHVQPEADVRLRGTEIRLNSASLGGAVYGRSGNSRFESSQLVQNSATADGGGLFADAGTVHVVGGRLSANTAVRDGGGGFSGEEGSILIESAVVAENSAGRHGGGLMVINQAELVEVSLDRNSVEGSVSQGGGISVDTFGSARLERSLAAGNLALLGGAAAVSGTLEVENSTLTDNAALEGAGIYAGGGIVSLASVTLAANRVVAGEEEQGGAAGIHREGFTGEVRMQNSILALGEGGADCQGEMVSEGYNLDSDDSCGLDSEGDLPQEDPGLTDLTDLGGPTRTLGLLVGSIAVDAADPAGCRSVDGSPLTVDQRGFARVEDGDGDGDARCDIGALELRIREPRPGGIYLPVLRKNE